MPLFPARIPCHVSSVPTPSGLTSPIPVTTTWRRCLWLNACRISLTLTLHLDVQRWKKHCDAPARRLRGNLSSAHSLSSFDFQLPDDPHCHQSLKCHRESDCG